MTGHWPWILVVAAGALFVAAPGLRDALRRWRHDRAERRFLDLPLHRRVRVVGMRETRV